MSQPLIRIFIPCLLFVLLMGINTRVHALHIVGADIYYVCLNPTTHSYRITLKMYRDCDATNQGAWFDDPMELFIFRGNNGSLYQTVVINRDPGEPVISPTTWGNCALGTPSICVHVGTYQTTVTLPPQAGGYDIGWARCCRTTNITNLNNAGDIGVTFPTHIPDPGTITDNSSPVYKNLPPTFLCKNQQLVFDHSALDPDGDSLVYQMTNPFTGLNTALIGAGDNVNFNNNPWAGPGVVVFLNTSPLGGGSQTNPMGPPPYQNAIFNPGYSTTNPFGSGNLVLDPQTGFLTVTPTQNGTFVLAISCFEYRNGVLLSETKRDIQINVINCLAPPPPPTITANLNPLVNSNDTVFVTTNTSFCFNHTITSTSSSAKLSAQGISNTLSNGATLSFTGTGTNSMTATFCWTPPCSFNNQTVRLIISARDTNYCQNVASVFDTIYINITSPPVAQPVITADLSALTAVGDTIYTAPSQSFCFPVTLTIPGFVGVPPFTILSPLLSGTSGATFSVSGTNPLTGTFCWSPSCAYSNQLIPISLSMVSASPCQSLTAQKTIWIRVIGAPNPPPTITANWNGLNVLNDTIDITAGDAPCFTFTLSDSDPNWPIKFNTSLLPGTGATFTTSGTNPLLGTLCWQSDCSYEGQVVHLQIEGSDTSQCSGSAKVFANIWVRVNTPPNNVPTFSANYSGITKLGDTLFVFATKPFCYSFTSTDADGDSLNATFSSTASPLLGTPTFAVTGTNPLSATICWTPDCAYEGQKIAVVMEVTDEAKCSNLSTVTRRLWIKVSAPPNTAPGALFNLSGFTSVGDTIVVEALDSLCIPFSASDTDSGQGLTATLISPVGAAFGNVTFTATTGNPLTGSICWTPACSYINQKIPVTIKIRDNAVCNKELEVLKTVWIKVIYPQNSAPVIATDLSGNNVSGGIIQIRANDTACFSFSLTDPELPQTITPKVSAPVSPANQPTMTFSGTNPVIGTICWASSCLYEGMTIPITIEAVDNPECGNFIIEKKVILVHVVRPTLIPPVVNIDLGQTPHTNRTIQGQQGIDYCMTFEIIDQTPSEGGTFYQYQFLDRKGQNLGYGKLTTQQSGDTLKGRLCINLGCNTGGGTYTIAITGYDFRECPPYDSTRAEVYIQVDPKDFGSYAGADASFCADEKGAFVSAIPINGIPTYSLEWFSNDPAGGGIQSVHTPSTWVLPTADSVEYYVQFTDSLGCTSKIDTVLIQRFPAPDVVLPLDTFICKDAPGVFLPIQVANNLPGKAPGPYSVRWIPGSGLSDSTSINPYANPDETTTYQAIVTSLNTGCSNEKYNLTKKQTVTVEVRTPPIINAGGDRYLCLGDTTTLSGFASGAGLPYLYAWSPASTGYMSDPLSPQTAVAPTKTTTYTLAVTSRGCAGKADSATVYVNALPTGSSGPDRNICYGETVQLAGNAPLPDTGFTYQWTPSTGLNDPALLRPLATPIVTTTYSLQVIGPHGCKSALYPVTLKVNPTPLPSVRKDTTLCLGDSIRLTSAYVSSGGTFPQKVSIRWTPDAGLSTATALNPWAKPETTTQYLLITQHLACADTAEVTISVVPKPAPDITLSDSVICAGEEIVLTVSGGLGNPSLTWVMPHGTAAPIQQESVSSFSATPNKSTFYTLIMREGACEATATQSVTVFPTPKPEIFGVFNGCDSLTGIYLSNSADAVAHAWDFGDGSPISNETQVEHVYKTGVYQLKYTALGLNGCRADSTYPVEITASPVASAAISADTLVLPGATLQLQTANNGAIWDFGDGKTATELVSEYLFTEAGEKTIILTVRDQNGCQDTLRFRVTVLNPTLEIHNVLTPNGDGKNDRWTISYNGNEPVSAAVFDRWGRLMYESDSAPSWNGQTTDGTPATTGVYFYQLTIGGKTYRGDLTLVR